MDNWEFDFSYKAGSTNLRAWEEKQSPWKIFPSLENEHERDVPWELLNYGKCQAKISLLFFGRKEFEMFGKTIDFPVCSLKLSLSTKPTEHFGKNPVGLALTGIFCDMVWWRLWDLVKETK